MSSSNNSNSNQPVVPSAREALNKFKMEAAQEVGVNLKQGYNGDLTSRPVPLAARWSNIYVQYEQ